MDVESWFIHTNLVANSGDLCQVMLNGRTLKEGSSFRKPYCMKRHCKDCPICPPNKGVTQHLLIKILSL